jgi:hypothetical protein
MDFMSDQLFHGRPFRILTVVDCHTRESLAIVSQSVGYRRYQNEGGSHRTLFQDPINSSHVRFPTRTEIPPGVA